jgi:hypothetical protein
MYCVIKSRRRRDETPLLSLWLWVNLKCWSWSSHRALHDATLRVLIKLPIGHSIIKPSLYITHSPNIQHHPVLSRTRKLHIWICIQIFWIFLMQNNICYHLFRDNENIIFYNNIVRRNFKVNKTREHSTGKISKFQFDFHLCSANWKNCQQHSFVMYYTLCMEKSGYTQKQIVCIDAEMMAFCVFAVDH